MPVPPPDPDSRALAVADAKRLLRVARTAALATLDPESGAPLVTLVGVVSDFSGAPLFLLSTLARHTRHLAADPRASLLLAGQPERGDALNHPRLTLNGRIEKATEPRARARYLQRYPKAKLYCDFADFAFFRLAVQSIHFNGGFGRADALAPDDILISSGAEAAFGEAEPSLLAWANGLGDSGLARLAGGKPRGGQAWRAIGLDPEGLDLSAGGEAVRVQFPNCARNEAEWRDRAKAILEG